MRKLTTRDINNLSRELSKSYVGYNEKIGIANGLKILGYITESCFLLLLDNFEAQAFEQIPVSQEVYKHILMRG